VEDCVSWDRRYVRLYGFWDSDRNGDFNGYVLEANLQITMAIDERHDLVCVTRSWQQLNEIGLDLQATR
jgi:hypothetical protein